MKRVLQCPTCLAKFNVDESVAGKAVACSKCNAKFTADMFPFANEEMIPNSKTDADEVQVSAPPPMPAALSPQPTEKKPRNLWRNLKIAYFICMLPFALLFTVGPIILRNNQERAGEELVKYLTLAPDERAEQITERLKSFLPEKPKKPAPPKVSYALKQAIQQDRVKKADALRSQGKSLLDAWNESGLIVRMNVVSGDVLIDPAAWQSRTDTDTQIMMVKTIGTQLQTKANMRMTVNLYCSESGQRLGTYHANGQISVFESSSKPKQNHRSFPGKEYRPGTVF